MNQNEQIEKLRSGIQEQITRGEEIHREYVVKADLEMSSIAYTRVVMYKEFLERLSSVSTPVETLREERQPQKSWPQTDFDGIYRAKDLTTDEWVEGKLHRYHTFAFIDNHDCDGTPSVGVDPETIELVSESAQEPSAVSPDTNDANLAQSLLLKLKLELIGILHPSTEYESLEKIIEDISVVLKSSATLTQITEDRVKEVVNRTDFYVLLADLNHSDGFAAAEVARENIRKFLITALTTSSKPTPITREGIEEMGFPSVENSDYISFNVGDGLMRLFHTGQLWVAGPQILPAKRPEFYGALSTMEDLKRVCEFCGITTKQQ